MIRTVHVVAVSARTPVGLCAESTAAAIRAGISRLSLHPDLRDAAGDALCCGRDALLACDLVGAARIEALARAALQELLAKLAAVGPLEGALELALALPEARPGFGAHELAQVLTALRLEAAQCGPRAQVRALATGHAGALAALQEAAGSIAHGTAELCVVGGADSYLDPMTLAWLEAERRVARDGIRGGLHPGEGASFLALASDDACRALQLPSLARIRGAASAEDPRSWDSDEGLLGEGLGRAIAEACAGRSPTEELIDACYGELNGERLRNDDWTFAALRVGQILRDPAANQGSVGACGDLGAASGALGCVLAVRSFQRNYAPGPRALAWGASWGGLRAACVLERGEP